MHCTNVTCLFSCSYIIYCIHTEKCTPTVAASEVVKETVKFTDAEIKKFTIRMENGYDLKTDRRYNLWLSFQRDQPSASYRDSDHLSYSCRDSKQPLGSFRDNNHVSDSCRHSGQPSDSCRDSDHLSDSYRDKANESK